jgi:subtilisin family serine protease
MYIRTLGLYLSILMLPPAIAADSLTFADRQQAILQLMQVEEAWKITRGGAGCIVGVVDSGFDFFHPALEGHIKPGWFAPGYYHTDFFEMVGHGTLVASLIAAQRKQGGDGMWGLAPGCTVFGGSARHADQ